MFPLNKDKNKIRNEGVEWRNEGMNERDERNEGMKEWMKGMKGMNILFLQHFLQIPLIINIYIVCI